MDGFQFVALTIGVFITALTGGVAIGNRTRSTGSTERLDYEAMGKAIGIAVAMALQGPMDNRLRDLEKVASVCPEKHANIKQTEEKLQSDLNALGARINETHEKVNNMETRVNITGG